MNDAGAALPLEITLVPSGQAFSVAAGQTILEAAALAGLQLPSSCRNGTCRACLCRPIEGKVVYRVDWPGLSAQEKSDGWILPCVAVPVSNLVVEQLHFIRADAEMQSRPNRGRGF